MVVDLEKRLALLQHVVLSVWQDIALKLYDGNHDEQAAIAPAGRGSAVIDEMIFQRQEWTSAKSSLSDSDACA